MGKLRRTTDHGVLRFLSKYNIIADVDGPLCSPLVFPSTMSSYRNHRVIIATLFLPQTAVLGDSPPHTPNPLSRQLPLSSLFNLKIPERPSYGRNKGPAPLKSIVEDMRDKVGWICQKILREKITHKQASFRPQNPHG